jgi:hypothetical protein
VEQIVSVQTADVSQLQDSSADDLLNEFCEKTERIRLSPLWVVLSILLVVGLLIVAAPTWAAGTISVICAAGYLVIRGYDAQRKTVFLNFDLDTEARSKYVELLKVLQVFASSARIWRVVTEELHRDVKYHAGAKTAVDRKVVSLKLSAPSFVETHLAVWQFALGNQLAYFFPDRVLIYQGGRVGAVSYHDLIVESSETRFVEDEGVPSDSDIVGRTWQYVNKNGGPDRRFSNNRELPVLRYATLWLRSSTGMTFELLVSDPRKATVLRNGLRAYAGC